MNYTAGIDIGSVTTKCVVTRDSEIVAKAIARTGVDSEKVACAVLAETVECAGIRESDLAVIVSTGYGRRIFKRATAVITEISAAGNAAYHILRDGCLVIDVGGQDTKIIEVNASGDISDFLMNDKCAAGTGRFLEMMAGVLETDLEGLSQLARESSNPVAINATCSVFAESEVVSLIAHAAGKEDIAKGIFNAIGSRIAGMIAQFSTQNKAVFCGGGAKSEALKQSIETLSGRKITVLPEPQFVVAFGAALKGVSRKKEEHERKTF